MGEEVKVDTRAGSKDYIEPLVKAGVPAVEATLAAGDVEIIGRGVGGRPVPVGIELKKWPDLLQCIRDGRFADQLKKMSAVYEVKWLLVEGQVEVREHGKLWWKSGRKFRCDGGHTEQEVAGWLLTMIQCGGILPWFVKTQGEGVRWLRSLWLWWTAKDFEEHRAHLDWYIPPVVGTWVAEPGPVQRVARTLPGVGSTLASVVAGKFSTPAEMITADVERWQAIEGIGKVKARKLVDFCQNGGKQ